MTSNPNPHDFLNIIGESTNELNKVLDSVVPQQSLLMLQQLGFVVDDVSRDVVERHMRSICEIGMAKALEVVRDALTQMMTKELEHGSTQNQEDETG